MRAAKIVDADHHPLHLRKPLASLLTSESSSMTKVGFPASFSDGDLLRAGAASSELDEKSSELAESRQQVQS
jgi:hypothetical protein